MNTATATNVLPEDLHVGMVIDVLHAEIVELTDSAVHYVRRDGRKGRMHRTLSTTNGTWQILTSSIKWETH